MGNIPSLIIVDAVWQPRNSFLYLRFSTFSIEMKVYSLYTSKGLFPHIHFHVQAHKRVIISVKLGFAAY